MKDEGQKFTDDNPCGSSTTDPPLTDPADESIKKKKMCELCAAKLSINYFDRSSECRYMHTVQRDFRFTLLMCLILKEESTIFQLFFSKTFSFNQQGYDNYSQINLSILFVYAYGLSFATLAATLSHVALFHGRSIWQQTRASVQDKFGDVHTRLMKKNYDPVPQWWFYSILIIVVGLSLLACEGFGRQLQLPYWEVLLAISLFLVFTLPIGVITATTNQMYLNSSKLRILLVYNFLFIELCKNIHVQQPGLNVITELIIGFPSLDSL